MLTLTACTDRRNHHRFGSHLVSRRLNLDHTDGPPDHVYFTRCNECQGFLSWTSLTYIDDASSTLARG